jgi:hypothetical protein
MITEAKDTFELQLTFKPQEGFGGGFRTEWLTGTNSEVTAGLDSGAGLGNPYLTFWIQPKDDESKRRYYNVDVRDILSACIDKARNLQ